MTKRWRQSAMLSLALGCLGAAIPATHLVGAEKMPSIKLGTLVPRGTSYHKTLLALKEKWRQAPGGGVNLIIYPDGTQGGEVDMVGLMQTGNLDAGLLTAVGLSTIESGVTGLQSIPMMFRSLEEVDFIGAKLQPQLEKRLVDKGFVVLFWVDAGWVRLFSKEPVVYPDDLRKLKIFAWRGDTESANIYRQAGFNPVSLETADIAPMLATGMISAVPTPPFFALASQLEKRAPYMLELNWAPLVGAALVRKKAWDKIPANAQTFLLTAAAEAGKEIKAKSRAESNEAVAAMQAKGGLIVKKVTPEIETKWREVAEAAYPQIRGKVVPAEIFDEVKRLLEEYRTGKGDARK